MVNSAAPVAQRAERILPGLKPAGWAFLFWLSAVLVQEFNRVGPAEAAVLLALFLFAIVMMRGADPPQARERPELGRALLIAVSLLLALQLVYAVARLVHPRVADIGHWVFAAGQAMLQGQNPYLLPLDPSGLAALGPRYQGYKYLPLMGWTYLPLGLPFGDRGLVATNLLLQLATVTLVWRLARRIGTQTAGRFAACLYLAVPLVAMQVLSKVSTDLVPVVPLLLALLCWERRPGVAGLLVGLSIAAKLTPGALFVPCLLPPAWPSRRRYALGLAAGLIAILPYAAWAPRAFFDNVVAFNLLRVSDESSWLVAMPAGVVWAAHGALLALLLAATLVVWRRPPTFIQRCAWCVLLMLAALLLGPSPHQNYHLWWLPLYSVLVAVTLARVPKADSRQL